MTSKRQQAEKRGRTAETIAATYLRMKGYRVIEQRFRSKRGEIDLIVKRNNLTAFIEVKARKTREEALYALTFTQRRRIEAAAEDWMKASGFKEGSLRFDIITVAPTGIPSHITDAWRVGE